MLLKYILHNFELSGEKVRLWQRTWKSYEHILMKALEYAVLIKQYPNLEIEKDLTAGKKIEKVPNDWFEKFEV